MPHGPFSASTGHEQKREAYGNARPAITPMPKSPAQAAHGEAQTIAFPGPLNLQPSLSRAISENVGESLEEVGGFRLSVRQADVVRHDVQEDREEADEAGRGREGDAPSVGKPPGVVCHKVQRVVHAPHGLADVVAEDAPLRDVQDRGAELADKAKGRHVDPDVRGGRHGHEDDDVGRGNEEDQRDAEHGGDGHLVARAREEQL
mmetsp:Transcript_102980/g.320923  ORF Transcript_102980/g.320923 Transcript_102980/m.320923 type:complete len:204 (+) Transcript_102980:2-613(+)